MAHLLQLNIPLTLKTNNMNNEFTPYEQALDLKKLGFNEECLAFYNSTLKTPNELLYPQYGGEVGNWNVENHLISAPLYQQAFRWFREKGYLMSISRKFFRLDNSIEYNYFICPPDTNEPIEDNILEEYTIYEEAELACLKKLIEIVKNK
jgi:hypothetical protein